MQKFKMMHKTLDELIDQEVGEPGSKKRQLFDIDVEIAVCRKRIKQLEKERKSLKKKKK